jgi:hypothetical protein
MKASSSGPDSGLSGPDQLHFFFYKRKQENTLKDFVNRLLALKLRDGFPENLAASPSQAPAYSSSSESDCAA